MHCAYFDGNSGIYSTAVSFAPPGTFAFWAQLRSDTTGAYSFTTGPTGYSFTFGQTPDPYISFSSNTGTSWKIVFQILLEKGSHPILSHLTEWNYYVGDFTTSESHLYINNNLVGSSNGSSISRNYYATGIGMYRWTAASSSHQYSKINFGPFRFFNKVLTEEERLLVSKTNTHLNHSNLQLEQLWMNNYNDTGPNNYQWTQEGTVQYFTI